MGSLSEKRKNVNRKFLTSERKMLILKTYA